MMPAGESKGLSDRVVDLRSDTYNLPTHGMLDRLRSAVEFPREGGAGEYTRELERAVSELTAKEAAVYLPSCSAANLLAVMALANPAENVVVDADSHIRWMEANSAAVTGGVQLVPVPRIGGIVDPAGVVGFAERAALFGLPSVGLICVENTHNNGGGLVVGPSEMERVSSLALRHRARVHVDGARIFNAAAGLGVEISDLCASATTVALSLNKSLGAPYGAALAGPQDVILKVKNLRGQLGIASIHQEGLLAAMALEALEHNREHPHLDNRGASELARLLTQAFASELAVSEPQTNIILFDILVDLTAAQFCGQLASRGVLAKPRSARSIRLVVNRESRQHDLGRVTEAFASVLGR
jgi:threonine aldolase